MNIEKDALGNIMARTFYKRRKMWKVKFLLGAYLSKS